MKPTPDIEAAWRDACLARERAGHTAYAALVITLVPVWAFFDAQLAPALTAPFLLLRLLDVAATVVLLAALRRTRDLVNCRIYGAICASLIGAMIAYMVAVVSDHFQAYVFGFSTVFWGIALLCTWPVGYTLAVCAAVLLTYAVLQHLVGSPRSTIELVGAGFYLGTAVIICIVVPAIQRRLHRRVFNASFELAQRNEELAVALTSLREAQVHLMAAEKQSALGRLVAQLSHELNNPLNVICNNMTPLTEYLRDLGRVLDAARAGAGPELRALWQELDVDFVRADCVEALETVSAAAQRMRLVHAELRVFVRGDAPGMVQGDLNEGLRATLGLLRRGLPPGVQVEAEYGALPRIQCQPGQINQVLHNLLQNALDAVGEQGRIAVRTMAVEGAVEVTVTDSGPGVPEAVRARLFEPFFTTKDVGKGMGLGLATCYQIVQHHGGIIELDAAHAPGARFVLRLPLDGGSCP